MTQTPTAERKTEPLIATARHEPSVATIDASTAAQLESEQERVRERRLFRDELIKAVAQRKAAQPRGRVDALLRAVNSPVGIWILSTIMVGAFAAAVQHFREVREDNRTTLRTRDELEFRYGVARSKIEAMYRTEDGKPFSANAIAASSVLDSTGLTDDIRLGSLYSEYAHLDMVSLLSLLSNKYEQLDDIGRRDLVRDVRAQMYALAGTLRDARDVDIGPDFVAAQRRLLDAAMNTLGGVQ